MAVAAAVVTGHVLLCYFSCQQNAAYTATTALYHFPIYSVSATWYEGAYGMLLLLCCVRFRPDCLGTRCCQTPYSRSMPHASGAPGAFERAQDWFGGWL